MTQLLRTTLVVNGREVTRTAPGHVTLLRWLRECAGQYDVKYGCGEGICGACTVLVDGKAVSSCLVPAARFDGSAVLTVSGLLEDGALNDLQQAFLEHGAAQCGFCTPGMLMAATELLASGAPQRETRPSAPRGCPLGPGWPVDEGAIREALHGNLCRCTGYQPIVAAVEAVSRSRGKAER